jgi:hypothetical protein
VTRPARPRSCQLGPLPTRHRRVAASRSGKDAVGGACAGHGDCVPIRTLQTASRARLSVIPPLPPVPCGSPAGSGRRCTTSCHYGSGAECQHEPQTTMPAASHPSHAGIHSTLYHKSTTMAFPPNEVAVTTEAPTVTIRPLRHHPTSPKWSACTPASGALSGLHSSWRKAVTSAGHHHLIGAVPWRPGLRNRSNPVPPLAEPWHEKR